MTVRHVPGLDTDQADVTEFPGNQPTQPIDISKQLQEIAALIGIPYENIIFIDFTPRLLIVHHVLDDRSGKTVTNIEVRT